MTPISILDKQHKLESGIKSLGSVLVAFSGGVDSALLLAVARSVLGDGVLAVTAQSPSLPERELASAVEFAKLVGAEHLVVNTAEMSVTQYTQNSSDRCYHCKSELYGKLQKIAGERKLLRIVNGTNLDDLGDHRPGLGAAREAKVVSPLVDAGFAKQDVRDLARKLGLPVWDKPAMACLSSRIPYGQPVTEKKLAMVERAEDLLLAMGFKQLRVRHHGDIARIELCKEDIARFFADGLADSVQKEFSQIGFAYTTVDIAGYKSGRLNEALKKGPAEKGSSHV